MPAGDDLRSAAAAASPGEMYGTHIDVIRVHDHIVIVGGDGAGACTHPDHEAAGHDHDLNDGHPGHLPEGHQR